MSKFGRTVVQHSGFGYNGHPQFEHALETREIPTERARKAIVKAGGLVFASYIEAEDFADAAMYPADNEGLIATARGTFADQTVDGLRVYVPVREVVG